MNSAKVTIKKTNKSPGTPGAKNPAELTASPTPPLKNTHLNSTIDSKRALALKPIPPVSRPTHAAAKVPTTGARTTDANSSATQSFAAHAVTPSASAPKAATAQDKQTAGP